MITLPFSILPGATRLFVEYCERNPNVRNYYFGHYSDVIAYDTLVQFLEQRDYPRAALADILEDQNRTFGSGPICAENIRLLREPRTLAVVTGQQVGLFCGPLYTIYKALTARHLCLWLSEQFPAHRFVPVFWLESEDHDLAEAGVAGFIDGNNDYTAIRYGEEPSEEHRNLRPVGGMTLGPDILPVLERVSNVLPKTEFTPATLEALRDAYRPESTFCEGFVRYFHHVLPDSGIVFFDPSDVRVKRLLALQIRHELETSPAAGEEVIRRSAELEERYHAQIKPRALNLFFLQSGKRHAIEPGEHRYFLRGTRRHFSKEELLDLVETSPESFSPNVMLRPVFQDTLFPTAAYVGGPSEIAYFAQLQPVYDHFQVPMPIVFPRASVTVVERKIQKLFNKFHLDYLHLFDDPERIYRTHFLDDGGDAAIGAFRHMQEEIERVLGSLSEFAAGVHPNLMDAAKQTGANVRRALGTFEERLQHTMSDRDVVIRRQLEKMQVYLAPRGEPQERRYGIANYLNRYGPDIVEAIDAYCHPFPTEHRLLFLE